MGRVENVKRYHKPKYPPKIKYYARNSINCLINFLKKKKKKRIEERKERNVSITYTSNNGSSTDLENPISYPNTYKYKLSLYATESLLDLRLVLFNILISRIINFNFQNSLYLLQYEVNSYWSDLIGQHGRTHIFKQDFQTTKNIMENDGEKCKSK